MDSTPRILIIDDDPQTLTALTGHYALIPASGPNSGLRFFDHMHPDLVLLSTAIDGWTLCAKIRAVSKVPIIILTDERETFDVIKAFEIGADDFLSRPIPAPLLRARIDSLLRRALPARRDLPLSMVCLAGRVYRAVEAEGGAEIRFSLTNADGFFFVRAQLKGLVLKEKEEILVIGRLRSSYDRRCRGHHGWLSAERILSLPQAKSLWRREGTVDALLNPAQL